MWGRGGRSTALDRAQAVLSGRRHSATESRGLRESYEDRNPAAKTPRTTVSFRDGSAALPGRKSPFLDLSDLSSSASSGTQHGDGTPGSPAAAGERRGREGDLAPQSPGGGGGRSRFLKKAAPPAASSKSPAFSQSWSQQPPQPSHVSSAQRSSQSAALSRLAAIEDRCRRHVQTPRGPTRDPGVSPPPRLHGAPASPPPPSSADDLGLKGKRFLKRTPSAHTDPRVGFQMPAEAPSPPPGGTGRAARPGAAEPIGAGRGVSPDSDEEDMRRLLGDSPDWTENSGVGGASSKTTAVKPLGRSNQKISPTPPAVRSSSTRRLPHSSPSPPRHGSPLRLSARAGAPGSPPPFIRGASAALSLSPSPPHASLSSPPAGARSGSYSRARVLPRSLSSSSVSEYSEAVRSLEELFPAGPEEEAPGEGSDASSDDFMINVMTLDDLAPVPLRLAAAPVGKQQMKTKPYKSKNKTPPLRMLTSEQQLQGQEEEEEEEIREEEAANYESDFESESRSEPEPGAASEISERLGGDGEDGEGVSGASGVVDELESDSDRSHRRTGADQYSSSSVGLSEDGSRSSASRTAGRHCRTSDASRSRGSSSYSDRDPDWSSSDTVTASHRSRRTSAPRRAVREAAVQTHPEALAYSWSAGMATLGPSVGMTYVDPTPIASHTVSAEAVEALSAYSPAVFALNDMLRQQLSLTRHFIYTNRHMHSSLLHSLGPADYTYTTLEDTKRFIRRHKPPALTEEEALEQVLQEMREYHYI